MPPPVLSMQGITTSGQTITTELNPAHHNQSEKNVPLISSPYPIQTLSDDFVRAPCGGNGVRHGALTRYRLLVILSWGFMSTHASLLMLSFVCPSVYAPL